MLLTYAVFVYSRGMQTFKFLLALVLICLFLTESGAAAPGSAPVFHDMRVNEIDSYVDLIEPEDPAVIALAAQFKTYEDAYRFVSDEIKFVPYVPSGPVRETLRYRVGSCIGKAVLLCSLYRAMGMPRENVRIVVGLVVIGGGLSDHVWIDMENNGKCLQQDPSGMLGKFGFHDFPDNSYVERYVMKESFCFNDGHLAIVSQLNRVRNTTASCSSPTIRADH